MDQRLTSSEISDLWTLYITNTKSVCFLEHFLTVTEDNSIKKNVQLALQTAQKEIEFVEQMFHKASHPIPEGFTKEDVNLSAPGIFTDNLILLILHGLAKNALPFFSLAIANANRKDVRDHFTNCHLAVIELTNSTLGVMKEKGLDRPHSYIPIPQKIDFVQRESFLTGWFGDRRPLSATEIKYLVFCLQGCAISSAAIKAYAQCASTKNIKQYLEQGVELFKKHFTHIQTLLSVSELPHYPTWEAEILESPIAPYSEKIVLFDALIFTQTQISRYGALLPQNGRRDVTATISSFLSETMLYAEDGTNLLIENNYLEQIPLAEHK